MERSLQLLIQPKLFAICRLPPDARVPAWAWGSDFTAVVRTPDELSIACLERDVPPEIRCERGWRCLKVAGPLDLSLTGVLASLVGPLAGAGISVFAISTYDTDYLLVRQRDLKRAVQVLARAGHQVRGGGETPAG